MSKLLITVSAIGLAAAIAFPGTASAREQGNSQAGISMKNSSQIEVSARKKKRHRYYSSRRYYRPYGYYAPYNAYAYEPYYYRPYYRRPGVSVGVGPFGFGFGF